MKIIVSPKSSPWTKFEKQEWDEVNKEYYDKDSDWNKKSFRMTASENGKTVGSLRMIILFDVAYIEALIVGKAHRLKGVGTQLMHEAEKIALKNDAHKIYLDTGKDWGTQEFYESLGFKKTADLLNHFGHLDFVQMTKFL